MEGVETRRPLPKGIKAQGKGIVQTTNDESVAKAIVVRSFRYRFDSCRGDQLKFVETERMEHTSNLVAYLRTRSGGREVLTPKQLEPILGISAKHQSLLRKENKLKIPYLVVGGKILYSIHAVAEMLTRPAENKPEPAQC